MTHVLIFYFEGKNILSDFNDVFRLCLLSLNATECKNAETACSCSDFLLKKSFRNISPRQLILKLFYCSFKESKFNKKECQGGV